MEPPADIAHSAHAGARRTGDRIVHEDAFRWSARAGLIARGLVYGVIGILAVELAAGAGGAATTQQGALQTIASRPFGQVLLVAVAVGLAGYAAWRLLRAAVGHGVRERDGTLDRIGGLASGVAYAGLCAVAVEILAGGASGGSSAPSRTTAGVLGWTGGPVLVAIAGLVLFGVGCYQGYKGLARTFMDESETQQMSRRERGAYAALGVFGHLARMTVFGLTGYGLFRAAVEYDPRQAIGLDGALRELAASPHGAILLGLVAAGLIGFGLYSIADARYRRP